MCYEVQHRGSVHRQEEHEGFLSTRFMSHLKLYQGQRTLGDFHTVLMLDPCNEEVTEHVEKLADMRKLVLGTISSGNIAGIARLLEDGADVGCIQEPMFPLHIAYCRGYHEIVKEVVTFYRRKCSR